MKNAIGQHLLTVRYCVSGNYTVHRKPQPDGVAIIFFDQKQWVATLANGVYNQHELAELFEILDSLNTRGQIPETFGGPAPVGAL